MTSTALPPDIPMQVGRLAINVAHMEALLHLVFASILDDDGTKTESILSRIDSIQYKMDVVFDLAQTSTKSPAKVLLAQKAAIYAAVQFRNTVAHSMFGTNNQGHIVIIKNAFRIKSALKEEPFTPDQAQLHADALLSAYQKIAASLDQAALPVRLTQAPKTS